MKARQIVITRPAKQAAKLAKLLVEAGYTPLYLPMIKTVPIQPNPALEAIIPSLKNFKWIVFTSVNAVDSFFQVTSTSVGDRQKNETAPRTKLPPQLSIAAIGPATAKRLADFNIKNIWLPPENTGECLAKELPFSKGDQILLPRADKAMKTLPEILAKRGARVTDLAVYETQAQVHTRGDFMRIMDKKPDLITFTSPSAVNSFKKHLEKFGGIKSKTYYAAIGPTTGKVLENNGFPVAILPQKYTLNYLVAAINDFFAANLPKNN